MPDLSESTVTKFKHEDFNVLEVSLLPIILSPLGYGNKHTILTVRKNGYTTFEAINLLASTFRHDSKQVHCQGLKDEDGVTEQLLSIEALLSITDIDVFNASCAKLSKGWIEISILGYTREPLKEKSLHGNIFTIKLRNLSEDDAEAIIDYCAAVPDFICANYYDSQRFGLPNGPHIAHQIGEAIVNGDWARAGVLYQESGNLELDFPNRVIPAVFSIKAIDYRKLNFFISAYSSYIWNHRLSEQVGGDSLIDIFNGHRVNTPQSTSQLGPLLTSRGYKINRDLSVSDRQKSRATFISTTIYAGDKQPDDCFTGKYTIQLQFFLSTGSYATMLVKQLCSQVQSSQKALVATT